MKLELIKEIDANLQETLGYALEMLALSEKKAKEAEEYEKKHGKSIRSYIGEQVPRSTQVAQATGGRDTEGQGRARAGEADWVRGLSGQEDTVAMTPKPEDNVLYKDKNGMGMYVVTRVEGNKVYLGKEIGFENRIPGHANMPNQLAVPARSRWEGGEKPGPAGGKMWSVSF